MRIIRTRSYAVAFAASAGVASLTMQQQPTDALRSSTSPLLFTPPFARTSNKPRTTLNGNRKGNRNPNSIKFRSSRTDADTETTETVYIQRKSYGAPVVDSTLLRFISQQKKVPEVFRDESIAKNNSSNPARVGAAAAADASFEQPQQERRIHDGSSSIDESDNANANANLSMFYPSIGGPNKEPDSEYDSTTNAIKQQLTSGGTNSIETKHKENKGNNNDDEGFDFVLANTLANTDPSVSASGTSWMAQFGSSNVAQLLLANGDITDASLAKTAGDAVEKYCVVRTARRRIRRFLKERDTLWSGISETSSSRSELESLASSDLASSPAASLLLSYAEQQQQRTRAASGVSSLSSALDTTATKGDDDDEFDANLETTPTPSYGFEDVLAIMKDYGLTGNDLCVLLTHSPNLALRVPSKSFLRKGQTDEAETLEETLERSLKGLLMNTLGLRRYDARKVLRTCPGLLSVRGSKSAVQVVTIMTKLGVSSSSLARDKSSLPVLLSRSPAGLFRLVAFLSSAAIRMPLEQIGPLLRRKVGRELMDALLPVPQTSYSKVANTVNANDAERTTEQGVGETEAAAASTAATTTLDDDAAYWSSTRIARQERIEQTYALMTQTARILKAQIGTQDLSKVVAAYPNVLLLDAQNQILPVARYLMGGLGIWQNDLSGVLQLYPTLLGTKIEDLERVVSYVLTLGVDEDDLAGIFRAFPGLFALPVEDMESVVSYLESIGVSDIGAFVTKLPPVLGYSVETELKPKWEFLQTVCLQPEFEVKEFPAYFSYPFDRVIKTRFNYLAYKGISIRFVSIRIDTVLRFGDVDFATKVALDDDAGEAFRLFGSQRGSSSAKGAAHANKLKKKKRNNRKAVHGNNVSARQNEAKAALAAAQRFSEDIDNAKDLAELNRIFREAAPLRNRSLGNSLPSLKPTRPKQRKQKQKRATQTPKNNKNNDHQTNQQRKQQQQSRNNSRNRGGEDGTFPCPA